MKVKFTGMMQTITSGCVPCGRGTKGKKAFSSSTHTIHLPSGIARIFHRNEVVNVSQLDGEWLLSWIEKDPSGMERHLFEEVND